MGNPKFGAPVSLGVASMLVSNVPMTRFPHGFRSSVLVGRIIDFVIARGLGYVSFEEADEPSADMIHPIMFGPPVFDPVSIVTMCIAMIVVVIESMGTVLALGDLIQGRITREDLAKALPVDGLGTLIGGCSSFRTDP